MSTSSLDPMMDEIMELINGTEAKTEEATITPEEPEPEEEAEPEAVTTPSVTLLDEEPFAEIEPGIERGKFLFSTLFWPPKFVRDFLVTCYKGYDAPEVSELYVPPTEQFEMFTLAAELNLKVNLVGPTGAGKDLMSEYYSAKVGRPHLRIDNKQDLDFAVVFGTTHITDGDTDFVPGVLPRALDKPTVVTLSELTRAPSFANIIYQRFLDRREVVLTMTKGEPEKVLSAHPDLVIAASDNTKGNGDDMDKYCASNVQDGAFINRWDMVIDVDYLDAKQEAEMIGLMAPDMPKATATQLARLSSVFHSSFKAGDLTVAFSPRNLSAICKMMTHGLDLHTSLHVNYIARLPKDEVAGAEEIIRSMLGS